MVWAKRIFLFLLVNFLVVLLISTLLSVFNIKPFLNQNGLDIPTLAIFCLIWGMGGAFISLALSKVMAKWMAGVQIIDPNTPDPSLREVLQTVYHLADKAGLPKRPEVGVYRSQEVNAFATGPSKRNALVAVSTGLLQRMRQGEVSGVLAHEVTHIANGDMVTMTLLQGIINAFVMFMARALAFVISRGLSRDRNSNNDSFGLFYVLTFVFEIIFMVLGSLVVARFSRFREFRADAGGARLAGKENMLAALRKLQLTFDVQDKRTEKPAFQAFKISSRGGFLSLFATHPPLEERIARLERKKE